MVKEVRRVTMERTESDTGIMYGMNDSDTPQRRNGYAQHVGQHPKPRCPATVLHLDDNPTRRVLVRDFFHGLTCYVRDGDDWAQLVPDFTYMSFDALLIGLDRNPPEELVASLEETARSRHIPLVVLCRMVTPVIEQIALRLKALTIMEEPYDLGMIHDRLCAALTRHDN